MDPLVIEAVEVLEVVHRCEEKINVAKERFFNIGLSVPRNFERFMSCYSTMDGWV